MGDSIMQYNDCTTYPQTGWPQLMPRFFPAGTLFENYARNGRSTKSFIDEGRFDEVLNSASKGDFVLIGFAHNDEKSADPTRYTSPEEGGTFRKNLEFFATELQKKGALPLLLTPVVRRKFDENGKLLSTHGEYPEAIRETAKKLSLPLIDLTKYTAQAVERAGIEKSLSFYMNFQPGIYENYPDGKEDNSHLRPDGAFMVSSIAARELSKLDGAYSPLAKSVILPAFADREALEKEVNDELIYN